MSDFHQNGIISTLHNFNIKTKSEVEKELKIFFKKKTNPTYITFPIFRNKKTCTKKELLMN